MFVHSANDTLPGPCEISAHLRTFSGADRVVGLREPAVGLALDPLPVELVLVVPALGVRPAAAVVLKGAVDLARGSHLWGGCVRVERSGFCEKSFISHFFLNLFSSLGQTPGIIDTSSMAMLPRLFFPTTPSNTICNRSTLIASNGHGYGFELSIMLVINCTPHRHNSYPEWRGRGDGRLSHVPVVPRVAAQSPHLGVLAALPHVHVE